MPLQPGKETIQLKFRFLVSWSFDVDPARPGSLCQLFSHSCCFEPPCLQQSSRERSFQSQDSEQQMPRFEMTMPQSLTLLCGQVQDPLALYRKGYFYGRGDS